MCCRDLSIELQSKPPKRNGDSGSGLISAWQVASLLGGECLEHEFVDADYLRHAPTVVLSFRSNTSFHKLD